MWLFVDPRQVLSLIPARWEKDWTTTRLHLPVAFANGPFILVWYPLAVSNCIIIVIFTDASLLCCGPWISLMEMTSSVKNCWILNLLYLSETSFPMGFSTFPRMEWKWIRKWTCKVFNFHPRHMKRMNSATSNAPLPLKSTRECKRRTWNPVLPLVLRQNHMTKNLCPSTNYSICFFITSKDGFD